MTSTFKAILGFLFTCGREFCWTYQIDYKNVYCFSSGVTQVVLLYVTKKTNHKNKILKNKFNQGREMFAFWKL